MLNSYSLINYGGLEKRGDPSLISEIKYANYGYLKGGIFKREKKYSVFISNGNV